ncbi:MAG: excinuclease ABC subunit UvrA [Bacteroides sp.]|nr:excinuclease ABC subunit UvrA [Bacteroides sp.]MCM1379415.1 excinuclease ABC subunit UvrA [Bacteroides sp.]MCM1445275.1 excinuclease ABC subunit UvrA [Prevotella sp.]
MNDIEARGVRVNNLKNVDVTIPRNQLVVITGLSGSGKSSLAFDTLYAEGRRRYVESLSAYARQFMGKMRKPEADKIIGLPPAIAIEQKVNTRNPRSTVGTSTEIYDYMRLIFGRVGHTFSPISGAEVKKHSVKDILDAAQSLPEGTRIVIASPLIIPEGRSPMQHLGVLLKGGYPRLIHNGKFIDIEELITAGGNPDLSDMELVIDRLSVNSEADTVSRIAQSAEEALFEGHDAMTLLAWKSGESEPERREFSTRFEADGMTFVEPSEMMFNFNNPVGACPTCEGFGKVMGIDEGLVVPDPGRSVYDDAVVCWRGEKMSEWKKYFIKQNPGFPIHTPYAELTQQQKDILWHGAPDYSGPKYYLASIDQFFKMVEENLYKIQYRVMFSRYRGKTVCPDCHGGRLRPEAQYVKVGGKTITELVTMPVSELRSWFDALQLNAEDSLIAARLLTEIRNRLTFLDDVGLGYLTLDRLSNTLSGGESQRINLATSLGSSLVGSLYILDEPSIGLHPRDTERLIGVLKKLRNLGNTVVVVEHDREIMDAADYIIDVGPMAGSNGGTIVYQGPADKIAKANGSYTADYLTGRRDIPVPTSRRAPTGFIEVKGAREHNLKGIDVKFPLGVMTVVTGVSGSGKSTLVRDILYRALVRSLGDQADAPGAFSGLSGDIKRIEAVDFIDQNPIGRSTRSNPATYLKAYDEIRQLFASKQASKLMGYSPAFFSFNAPGGRCEECNGEGTITIEMQFMADITIPCEACRGLRFRPEILEVKHKDKTITDVLDMTVDEAIDFFSDGKTATERRIVERLQPLREVGLGYVKLGQSSSTLSGGENQRVKLAYYLAQESPRPTLFIFDEPTTGLHFHDISTLMHAFNRLIEAGHTVLIIEHNIDVIKCADYVIDIGPEGGDRGGQIVATGTPEQIVAIPGHTATALKQVLTPNT